MTNQRILGVQLDELTRRTSSKWCRYPADVLPMWVAEMDVAAAPGAAAALRRAIDLGDLGYSLGNGYAEAFSEFASQEWGWKFDPATQARVCADVLSGIRLLISLLTRPGDGIVINPPVYPPFFAMAELVGRKTIQVPLTSEDRLDLAALEQAFSSTEVTAHLLCSPHNPTSTVHTQEELTQLAEIASRHNVVVIADEIHGPIASADFVPYPMIDPLGFAVTSASKSWNLAGLKGGLMIGGSAGGHRLAELSIYETEYSAGHLAIIAHSAALRLDRDWLAQLRTELARNRQLLVGLLAEHLPEVSYIPRDGTYLAWLDCRALGLEDPMSFFLEQASVALNPGGDFGPDHRGFVRMNLATSPQIITSAVARMSTAVASRRG